MRRFLLNTLLIFYLFTLSSSVFAIPWIIPQHAPTNMTELLVDVYINHVDMKQVVYLLKDQDEALWIAEEDLQEFRLSIPRTTNVFF